MNTEKIAKYKKSLENTNIPANVKTKIEAEIKRLEDLDAKQKEASEKKEEAPTPAPAKKTRAKRTPKATPSRTSKLKSTTRKKPTRTVMSVAKEIRKEGESWKDAQARARKMMKADATEVTKKVESELDKLNKLVKSKKELRGMSGKTNLLRDASRKALPAGKRISHKGWKNQYGTSDGGTVYYENRANRADRGTYGKYHLAKGGNLESKNYEIELFWIGLRGDDRKIGKYVVSEKTLDELESQWAHTLSIDVIDETNEKPMTWYSLKKELFSKGREKNLFAKGGSVINERRHVNHDEDYEVRYAKSRPSRTGYKGKRSFSGGGDTKQQLKKGDDVLIIGRRWFDKANGNTYHTAEVVVNDKVIGKSRMSYGYEEQYIQTGKEILLDHFELPKGMKESSPLWQLREYGVEFRKRVTDGLKRDLELGGNVGGFDLAGHLDGTFNVGQDDGMLSGVTGTQYSGLVGETGAMSSGEMFARGGGVEKPVYIIHDDNNDSTLPFRNLRTISEIEAKANELGYVVSKTKNNDWIAIAKTPTGQDIFIAQKMNPSGKMFSRGGSVRNERRHVNHNEDYEVRYARNKPSRTGYKGKRSFADGGDFQAGVYAEGGGVNKKYLVGEFNEQQLRKGDDKVAIEKAQKQTGLTYIDNKIIKKSGKPYMQVYLISTEDYLKSNNFENGGDFQAGVYADGGGLDSPRIYVADLEAYNNGRLVGEWLDLSDYNDADELNDAIQELLNGWGKEEYAIHDAENLPSGMYSEYMGARDFEELYEMMDLAKENDLPLAVVQEIVSQYDTDAIDNFYGRYDSAVDFAEQLVDDTGIQSFTDFERYLIISDTDKRLLAQEMADSYVDDIKDEDEGERLIGEADLDLEEYQEADDDTREEMLEKAREIVYDRYYEEWETGLDDPYYFLVEEQGMYDAESFANANFVQIDYDAIADALEYDYTFVSHDGEVYVFNIH